jgi:hypothetical protein
MTFLPSISCLLYLILPLLRILTPLYTNKSAIPPRHPSHIIFSFFLLYLDISLTHLHFLYDTTSDDTTAIKFYTYDSQDVSLAVFFALSGGPK